MQRIHVTPENLDTALEAAATVLSRGGLVAYPTETVYGLGADAANPEAVGKLLAFKSRSAGKAVSVLVADQRAAERLVELNDAAANLYATFLPGPLTVVSASRGAVDKRLESELGTLGIRISSHPVAAHLAAAFGGPITATSFNASGAARPYSVDTALAGLSDAQLATVDLVLDTGALPRREPSSVIDTTQAVQEVVRSGELAGKVLATKASHAEADTVAVAQAFMKSLLHAMSEKPVVILLEGPMGAGKTHFAKGVALALDIEKTVTSPTYTLVKEYGPLVHMDCWRLGGEAGPQDLGLDDYLKPGKVVLIEWPLPVADYLAAKKDEVVGFHTLFDVLSETERTISFREL